MAKIPNKTTKLYNDTIEIGFWEARHRYSLIKNGIPDKSWIISVTGATSMIDKSRVLIRWAVGMTSNYLKGNIELLKASTKDIEITGIIENACIQHEQFKKEAANLGIQVHSWCEEYIKTKPSERKKIKLPTDKRVLNGATAFLRWIKQYKVEFIEAERMVYSKKYDYVGLMDLKARVNGKLACVDFKTSKGVYNDYRYQVSAYMMADEEETSVKYDEMWILKFSKEDGEFEAYLFEDRKELEKDYKCFLGALEVKKREKELYNIRPEPEC